MKASSEEFRLACAIIRGRAEMVESLGSGQFCWQAFQELDGSNPAIPTANLLTGLTIDDYFQRVDLAGARSFLSDDLGSVLALADGTGTIQSQYVYDAFGSASSSGQTNANSYQFTGRENDGTGLQYYRARYYSPGFNRFISQDPIEFGGDDPNLYGYTYNSPPNRADPSGLWGGGVLVGGGAEAGIGPGMGVNGSGGAGVLLETRELAVEHLPLGARGSAAPVLHVRRPTAPEVVCLRPSEHSLDWEAASLGLMPTTSANWPDHSKPIRSRSGLASWV